jgi:hypothetical protein
MKDVTPRSGDPDPEVSHDDAVHGRPRPYLRKHGEQMMGSSRVHSAYSLEIVVPSSQFKKTGQVIAGIPGHVEVRASGPQTSGWIRLVLSTDGEENLLALESKLRSSLDFHMVHCEDRVLARSRGGKTRTHASVPLETAEDLAIAYTPGVGRVSTWSPQLQSE